MLVHASFSRYCEASEITLTSPSRLDGIDIIMDGDNGSCFFCFDNRQRYLQATFAFPGTPKRMGISIVGYNMDCNHPHMVVFSDWLPEEQKFPSKYQCAWETIGQSVDSQFSVCQFWCDSNITMGPVHVSVVLQLLPWKSDDPLPVWWCETMFISKWCTNVDFNNRIVAEFLGIPSNVYKTSTGELMAIIHHCSPRNCEENCLTLGSALCMLIVLHCKLLGHLQVWRWQSLWHYIYGAAPEGLYDPFAELPKTWKIINTVNYRAMIWLHWENGHHQLWDPRNFHGNI